ncbi:MAG: hypothetical protein KDK23_16220 [Leptospiraceae bacterium]|nr:hypothetical protein [Leptospiraceae bacterium]
MKKKVSKKKTTSRVSVKKTSPAAELEINPQQRMFASRPTGFTRWMRKSLLWQSIRFVVINVRMLFMISKAQPGKVER